MLNLIYAITDGLSRAASRLADVSVAVLVCAMVYEVAARYLFDAPTEWAFDIAYMSNGAIFLLGLGWVLRQDGHIRSDVIRKKIPSSITRVSDSLVYLVILMPLFGLLRRIAINKTIHAWQINEVETVSPWAPFMWPFYLIISVGLVVLTLQFLAQGLRRAFGDSTPGEAA